MFEAHRDKAVNAMINKLGETVQSKGQDMDGLVKFHRLDPLLGHIKTNIIGLTVWVRESEFDRVGETMTVRNEEYEVVRPASKSQYNGMAQNELIPLNNSAQTGAWR